MNEQQITEAYPKICKWLGKKYIQCDGFILDENGRTNIDFLHDANQREWIVEKLQYEDYIIAITLDIEGANVTIYNEEMREENPSSIETFSDNKLSIALLQAVMELIDQNPPC